MRDISSSWRISRARFFPVDDFGLAVTPSSRSRRGDQADTVKRVVLRVNRDIYFASSPPPWLRPFSHLLRRFRRTCRVCVSVCCTHIHRCIYTRIRAECSGSQHSCGITPPFSRLLGTAQHPSSATSGQARLRPLLY